MTRFLQSLSILCGLAGLGVAWVLYFWRRDPGEREPRFPILVTFGLGVVAGTLCGAYRGATGQTLAWIVGSLRGMGFWRAMLESVIRIGLVEELAKFLPVWLYSVRSGYFDEPGDGLVYATTSAVGFATAEAASVLGGGMRGVRLLGLLALPVTHALFSSAWGWGLGRRVIDRRCAGLWATVGVAVASVTHGVYDVVLFRTEVPNPVVVALILVLWLWFMRVSSPRRRSDTQITEGACGSPPQRVPRS